MKPLIHFIHGKESGPWGSKILHLADIAKQQGYDVESLNYAGITHPEERVKHLLQAQQNRPADILVGSSMGGWIAVTASAHIPVRGLFLMAPALYMPDYPPHTLGCPGEHITIVHGWHDPLIPWQHVARFSEENACTLHLIDDAHRLKNRLAQVGEYFTLFLSRLKKTSF